MGLSPLNLLFAGGVIGGIRNGERGGLVWGREGVSGREGSWKAELRGKDDEKRQPRASEVVVSEAEWG